jgi:SAM-dependent methyltransferase
VPLANAFLRADQLDQPEPRFPLEVFFCEECGLVQLMHVVHPEILFSNYIYRTGTNQTIAAHNASLADTAVRELGLSGADLVVEIASNDGSLLQCFRDRGVRTLGVEPAGNIAQIAREAGIDTLVEFFDPRSAAGIARQHGLASAVVANNVLAHVDATTEFLAACKSILQPEGSLIIEVPYLVEMLQRLEYDTIYHEHLCYFSVNPLLRLFDGVGLALERIDRVPIHGGSLRLWARHAGHAGHSQPVRQIAQQEQAAGLAELSRYRDFADRVASHREQLLTMLHGLKREGRSVVGYGAPAKGNTLLCYCGITTELVAYTADRSPLKVGMFTPGTHIPVVPVERIFRDQPDYVLILAWNFADEIMETLRSYHERGGRFILPVPEPRIV